MKIAFVVQRYGAEVLGGSEFHCRLVAEHLAPRHEVEVLTTCARDYITWKNEYPEGSDRIRGVTVRRFANAATRDIQAFNRYSEWIFTHPHSRDDEMAWLKQQGPWCPGLIAYLRGHHQHYDALIFFTYLYAPTVIGIEVMQDKPPYIVVARPEIHGFADLKGKVVAQNDIFSVAAYVFRQVLRFNGLTDKDYTMIGAGNDRQRLAALTTNRIQATTFSPPTHLMALKAGMKSLGLAKDYTRAANGVGTTVKKIKESRDQVRRFLRILLKTDRWMKSHPKETIDFIMADYKLDRETAASSYELLMPTLSDNGQIGDDYIQEIIERWRQQSGAPAGVSLDRVRDFSIVREAAKELGVR